MELITQILLGLITAVIVVFAYMIKGMHLDDDEQPSEIDPNAHNVNSVDGLMEILDQAKDELQEASDALAGINEQTGNIRRNRSRLPDLEDDAQKRVEALENGPIRHRRGRFMEDVEAAREVELETERVSREFDKK